MTSEVPEPVRNPAELRCSDVDRERVAEALRKAAGDGRLSLTELDDRLEAAFKARTYGDLRPITHDLPQGPYPLPGAPATWSTPDAPEANATPPVPARPTSPGPAPARQRISTILSEEKRKGKWEVAERIDITTVCGSVELDFTEAIVKSDEVIISGAIVLGSLKLIVPHGTDVQFEGTNVLGEQKSKLEGPTSPDAPTIRIRGVVLLGEIQARSPRRK